jgi:thiamine-phosphate pyrophosphorylase
MTPAVDFTLYLITDRHQTQGRPLEDVVAAALQGGVRAVQLREKDLADDELYRLALSLRRLTSAFGARLLINRRLDICRAVGADGVQTGIEGPSPAELRSSEGEGLLIGYSSHGLEEACSAEANGASFVTFGPVYPTPSKAAYGAPLGPARLKQASRHLKIPLFALGGICPATICETLACGARGIALISAVMAAPNPETAARSLLTLIEEHADHS